MILVDDLRRYRGRIHSEWCHMVSDLSEDELHAMARRMQLRRYRFRRHSRPHYDLRPSQRAQAIALGAVAVTRRELIRRMPIELKKEKNGGVLHSGSPEQGQGGAAGVTP